ncbi:MAG: PEP-CTERM sorting domain-containing protein [Rhodopirellula sp.]|nr:PEP-CTERM sorting domain-containing protein [Rhodopirellula sp.]
MKRAIFAGLIVLLSGPAALTATITAGDPSMDQTSGNLWTITFSDGIGTTAFSTNLFLSIGDPLFDTSPSAVKPIITSIIFDVAGYFYNGAPYQTTFSGASIDAGAGASLVAPSSSNGTFNLAQVTFDASSADPGVWEFNLHNLADTQDSKINTGPSVLANGSITVNAVPEPATLVQLLILVCTGGLGFWLQRRKKAA